jgi:hypothetical protein
MADTSMGPLQKLRKAQEIQKNFREQAAKVLTPDQVQKLEALQAERRAKLRGELGGVYLGFAIHPSFDADAGRPACAGEALSAGPEGSSSLGRGRDL